MEEDEHSANSYIIDIGWDTVCMEHHTTNGGLCHHRFEMPDPLSKQVNETAVERMPFFQENRFQPRDMSA